MGDEPELSRLNSDILALDATPAVSGNLGCRDRHQVLERPEVWVRLPPAVSLQTMAHSPPDL